MKANLRMAQVLLCGNLEENNNKSFYTQTPEIKSPEAFWENLALPQFYETLSAALDHKLYGL